MTKHFKFLSLELLGFLELLQNKGLAEQVGLVQVIAIDYFQVPFFLKWMNLMTLKS
jgi:hypothetical protein